MKRDDFYRVKPLVDKLEKLIETRDDIETRLVDSIESNRECVLFVSYGPNSQVSIPYDMGTREMMEGIITVIQQRIDNLVTLIEDV